MLTQIGVITALSATDGRQPIASIRVLPPSACAKCASGEGCGAGLFARLLRMRPTSIDLPVSAATRPGQRVWLAMDEQQLARQALFWYGLPVLGFLAGAALPVWLLAGSASGGNLSVDGLSLLSGLSGLAMCWLAVRRWQHPVRPRVLLEAPCSSR